MEPVRCFTCNKVIGPLWRRYRELCQTPDLPFEAIMKELGLRRYCCKRMMKTSVDVTQQVLDYQSVHNTLEANKYITVKTETVDATQRVYSTD